MQIGRSEELVTGIRKVYKYAKAYSGKDEIEFSGGFTDLHTISYKNILAGKGYGLADARPSVYIVHSIRNKKPIGKTGEYHPFV